MEEILKILKQLLQKIQTVFIIFKYFSMSVAFCFFDIMGS